MNYTAIIRHKPIKLLEENIGVNFHEFVLGKVSSHTTPKTKATNEKKNWTSSILKTLVLQRHYQESENICKSYF